MKMKQKYMESLLRMYSVNYAFNMVSKDHTTATTVHCTTLQCAEVFLLFYSNYENTQCSS